MEKTGWWQLFKKINQIMETFHLSTWILKRKTFLFSYLRNETMHNEMEITEYDLLKIRIKTYFIFFLILTDLQLSIWKEKETWNQYLDECIFNYTIN